MPSTESRNYAWVAPAALALLATLTYSNTFRAEFVFDDFPHLIENPLVRDLGFFAHPERVAESEASGVARAGFRNRPVSMWTFALNYRAHGLDVVGYHVVNLVIHLFAGLLLYRFVRKILALPFCERSALRAQATSLAFFVAAVFLVHPLQTQAVTYVVQRMTSLAGMFCVLSAAAYLEFRLHPERRSRWLAYAAALVSLVAAMHTKESAATFPLIIAGFELLFVRGSLARRSFYLLPILGTSAIVPLRMLAGAVLDPALLGSTLETVRASTDIPRTHYLFTQFGVIATYLRLLLWPAGQNLDPERSIYTGLAQWPVALPLLGLIALAAAGLSAIKKSRTGDPAWRLVGFGIGWFFVALAVESSVIPIADLLVEHRLYLPSAGIFLSAVSAIYLTWPSSRSRWRAATQAVVVLALGTTAFARNEVWRTRLTIWKDSAAKSPNKPRPSILYASALAEAGRRGQAIAEYRRAVVLGPGHFRAWTNLGNLLLDDERPLEALTAFERALGTEPRDIYAQNGRGLALRQLGRHEEALGAYRKALRIDPAYAAARNNLGNLLREIGRPDLAVVELEAALRLVPDSRVVQQNLEQVRREVAARARQEH